GTDSIISCWPGHRPQVMRNDGSRFHTAGGTRRAGFAAPEQQISELRLSFSVEARDLTVESHFLSLQPNRAPAEAEKTFSLQENDRFLTLTSLLCAKLKSNDWSVP